MIIRKRSKLLDQLLNTNWSKTSQQVSNLNKLNRLLLTSELNILDEKTGQSPLGLVIISAQINYQLQNNNKLNGNNKQQTTSTTSLSHTYSDSSLQHSDCRGSQHSVVSNQANNTTKTTQKRTTSILNHSLSSIISQSPSSLSVGDHHSTSKISASSTCSTLPKDSSLFALQSQSSGLSLDQVLATNVSDLIMSKAPLVERIIHLMVKAGARLDLANNEGKTPLHLSAQKSNFWALKTLLDLGAESDCRDANGLTPLYYSILERADLKVTQLLLSQQCQSSFNRHPSHHRFQHHRHSIHLNNYYPFTNSTSAGGTIEEDGEVDHQKRMNNNNNNSLLSLSTSIGLKDAQGWQEVHHACKLGLDAHLEKLLYYGCDMNAKIDGSGNTPLHVAAINDQINCAKVLLMRGADKTIINSSHQTALQVAVISGNLDLAEFISEHTSDQVIPFKNRPSDFIRGFAALSSQFNKRNTLVRSNNINNNCNNNMMPNNNTINNQAPSSQMMQQQQHHHQNNITVISVGCRPSSLSSPSSLPYTSDSSDVSSLNANVMNQLDSDGGHQSPREELMMVHSNHGSMGSRRSSSDSHSRGSDTESCTDDLYSLMLDERPLVAGSIVEVTSDYHSGDPSHLQLHRGDLVEILDCTPDLLHAGQLPRMANKPMLFGRLYRPFKQFSPDYDANSGGLFPSFCVRRTKLPRSSTCCQTSTRSTQAQAQPLAPANQDQLLHQHQQMQQEQQQQSQTQQMQFNSEMTQSSNSSFDLGCPMMNVPAATYASTRTLGRIKPQPPKRDPTTTLSRNHSKPKVQVVPDQQQQPSPPITTTSTSSTTTTATNEIRSTDATMPTPATPNQQTEDTQSLASTMSLHNTPTHNSSSSGSTQTTVEANTVVSPHHQHHHHHHQQQNPPCQHQQQQQPIYQPAVITTTTRNNSSTRRQSAAANLMNLHQASNSLHINQVNVVKPNPPPKNQHLISNSGSYDADLPPPPPPLPDFPINPTPARAPQVPPPPPPTMAPPMPNKCSAGADSHRHSMQLELRQGFANLQLDAESLRRKRSSLVATNGHNHSASGATTIAPQQPSSNGPELGSVAAACAAAANNRLQRQKQMQLQIQSAAQSQPPRQQQQQQPHHQQQQQQPHHQQQQQQPHPPQKLPPQNNLPTPPRQQSLQHQQQNVHHHQHLHHQHQPQPQLQHQHPQHQHVHNQQQRPQHQHVHNQQHQVHQQNQSHNHKSMHQPQQHYHQVQQQNNIKNHVHQHHINQNHPQIQPSQQVQQKIHHQHHSVQHLQQQPHVHHNHNHNHHIHHHQHQHQNHQHHQHIHHQHHQQQQQLQQQAPNVFWYAQAQ